MSTDRDPESALGCFVYGQGQCAANDPLFEHWEKRLTISEFLIGLEVEAELPENADIDIAATESWLEAQLRASRSRDFIVALQPPGPGIGPPTLKEEVSMAVADPVASTKLLILAPFEGLASWDAQNLLSLDDEQVLVYDPALYAACSEIRDLLDLTVERIRDARTAGQWPLAHAGP